MRTVKAVGLWVGLVILMWANCGLAADGEEFSFQVNPGRVLNRIDEKVYGHFLEHIYHSANNGLWGDLVWNRSMEIAGTGGLWTVEGDELVQSSRSTDIRLLFGDASWGDYEFSCEAMKTGGGEGFLILFRADGDNYYWYNLGGWGNTRHALEKGTQGRGRGQVGRSMNGRIERDKWYKIVLRCKGGQFTITVDGEEWLSYDDSSAHLKGQVGLGTWATQARYRHIKVTDLAGKVLYQELPQVSGDSMPDDWSSYGEGSFEMTGNALNDEYCVKVAGSGSAEAGIEQTPFYIIPQAYQGSLWARGQGGSLIVRLLDGERTLAQARLGKVSASWGEFKFVLKPKQGAKDATLQVGVRGGGTVWIDQVSLMGQDAIDIGGYRPDLYQAVADLRAPIIRWPGGCYASAYRWKTCIGPQYKRVKYPLNLWDDQDTNSYGTDEFLRMCEAQGVEPLIVINCGVLNSTCGAGPIVHPSDMGEYLQDALDWMEYCNGATDTAWGALRAKNGHLKPYGVKYWEIDNETWGAGVEAYIAKVKEFAPAMRAADPSIKLLACGSGSYDMNWNRKLIDACGNLFDYISIHHYESPDRFKEGPRRFEAYIGELGNYISQSSNPKMKIYMSEWNAQSTDWRTGLYAGGLLNGFSRRGDVFEIGGPALFLRHVSARAWDNAFINFDHTGWFAAPNYIVMKLWWDHYAPERIELTGPDDNLNVLATRSQDGKTVYLHIVNPDNTERALSFGLEKPFVPASAEFKYVAPGGLNARNTLEDREAIQIQTKAASLNGQQLRLSVPGYSAGVITITSK